MPTDVEATVVASLKRFLLAEGLSTGPVGELLVDAHPSYVHSRVARQLEPMGSVWIGRFRPDVVCSTGPTRQLLVAGIEVKPSFGMWPQGLAQARSYRMGVHHPWLAIPAPTRSMARDRDMLEREARDSGVGVLMRQEARWCELCPPADPRPQPDELSRVSAMLAGVPVGRRLQLNHPLNYLVVPFLRSQHPEGDLTGLLVDGWPDLGTEGSRRHAVEGARALRLVDARDDLTDEGATVADLLGALGFDPGRRPPKTQRLADVAPGLAAVARLVLLRQPPVRLIMDSLARLPNGAGRLQEVVRSAAAIDPALAAAVFLVDPSADPAAASAGDDFSPSTVFKLKQVLWHAGLLSTGAHPSATRGRVTYDPLSDIWRAERR